MDKFLSDLENQLQKDLPGKKAHDLMASTARKSFNIKPPENPRLSAVLIVFYPHQNDIYFPLILRPTYDGVHSGQMGLPGGKKEDHDKSLIHTAIRETHEEIGVFVPETEILGSLTDLYIPPSNMLVTPVSGFSTDHPSFQNDPNEVAELVPVTLQDFQNESNKAVTQIKVQNFTFDAPTYQVSGKTIWGATAMIISELLTIIQEI